MSPREKYSSLKHLILEVPLDRVNKKELIAKTNLFSQDIENTLNKLVPLSSGQLADELADYFGCHVHYKECEATYYVKLHTYQVICRLVANTLVFAKPLPPRLVSRLAMFYEGLV